MEIKRSEKSEKLTHTYYRSFLLLIVIPLILVFVVAEGVSGYLIRNASMETIDAVQEKIATVLSNDVKTNAKKQAAHTDHISPEICQCPAGLVASPGRRCREGINHKERVLCRQT